MSKPAKILTFIGFVIASIILIQYARGAEETFDSLEKMYLHLSLTYARVQLEDVNLHAKMSGVADEAGKIRQKMSAMCGANQELREFPVDPKDVTLGADLKCADKAIEKGAK